MKMKAVGWVKVEQPKNSNVSGEKNLVDQGKKKPSEKVKHRKEL